MPSGTKSVVFFGTGPVAAQSLELLAKNFAVEAVVTKPKPAHHRGDFPVLDVATRLDLKVLEVTDKKSLSELFNSKPVKSRLGIVIDFGIIIAQDVIDCFELGIVNSHFSLLPRWRGADPISFAILEGDTRTGVSLMVIDAGLDTGKLITQKVLQLDGAETVPTLTTKLIQLNDLLLAEYLPKYITGDIKPHNQPHPDRATHSRKLTKEDGIIDWTKPAAVIEREIRAFLEWPKSRATLGSTEVIVTKTHVVDATGKPGEVKVDKGQLLVFTGDKAISIDKLKPAGKKEMSTADFIRGYIR